jgi:hypothetical protein
MEVTRSDGISKQHCRALYHLLGAVNLNNQDVYISKDLKHVRTQEALQQLKWCRLPPSF